MPDGRKTIFYIDCTGVQFKESLVTIGYLQLEAPGCMGNNMNSNFYVENTYTFSASDNSIMNEVYQYVVTRMEGYKYKDGAVAK